MTSPLISAAMFVASSVLLVLAGRVLPGLLVGALVLDGWAQWRAGLRPDADAHGAMVYMASFLQLQLTAAVAVMAAFAIARCLVGWLDRRRRVVFDNLSLLWHYTAAQGLLGLLLIHGFPRVVA